MLEDLYFPFGQKLKNVVQENREQKNIFVLGVYASAVHAKWVDKDNKTVVQALAVASEPYIFWKGENAQEIISKISIPSEIGKLVPANRNLNGPSGNALDELYLEPLGENRDSSWICDLVPHACLNDGQTKAIKEKYNSLIDLYNLPQVTIPRVPLKLTDEARRQEILKEIEAANPKIIVLLGDDTIRWFLSFYDSSYRKLSDFGFDEESYGKVHAINIDGNVYKVLPLVHPRVSAGLGRHSKELRALHMHWIKNKSNRIRHEYL